MYIKPKYTPGTPESPRGVLYFNHFPTDFLRPYSKADPRPDENTIFRRINPKSCEWLTRPKIAMSEFASTITENLELLATKKTKVVKMHHFAEMQQRLAPFLTSLNSLNQKRDDQPSASDVQEVLRTMLTDDDQTEDFFEQLVETGAAMYSIGIHYAVLKTLITNPCQFAQRLVGTTPEVSEFKSDPTIPGVQRLFTRLCATKGCNTPTPHVRVKRNLADLLVGGLDDAGPSTSSAHLPIAPTSDSDDSLPSQTPQQPKSNRKRTSHLKTHQRLRKRKHPNKEDVKLSKSDKGKSPKKKKNKK